MFLTVFLTFHSGKEFLTLLYKKTQVLHDIRERQASHCKTIIIDHVMRLQHQQKERARMHTHTFPVGPPRSMHLTAIQGLTAVLSQFANPSSLVKSYSKNT